MPLSTAVVLATVAGVALLWLRTLSQLTALGESRRAAAAAVGVIAGLVVPGVLAFLGVLGRYDPMPAPALLLVAAVTLVNLTLVAGPVGGALASHVSLKWLVGFQVFRVPVEWWLHRLFEEGVIPVEMTWAGRNFDVVSGVTALLLAVWFTVGRPPRAVVLLWNVLGLALLANIVVVAVLATPVPFRLFTDGPANTLPSTFPFVWLPTFLVQAALMGHLLVFRAARRFGVSS